MDKLIIKFRSQLLTLLTNRFVLPFLQTICTAQKFEFTKEMLFQLRAGTLGRELATMPVKKTLRVLPYYSGYGIRHMVLFNDITDEGRLSLWCFIPTNKLPSFPVTATLIYEMITTPGYCSEVSKGYWRDVRRLLNKSGDELAGFYNPHNYSIKN